MPAARSASQYVPALDGVRALAVLAVLLYHLESSPLPGGFLGVSTFFTLSGFLITSLLLQERETRGTIDLPAFWGRRWRRLLPALLACLVLVVAASAAGAFVPAQVDAARDGIPWALGYLANWHQLFDGGGYLQDLAAPSPLEHLWSLGIEEQFYVAFPLIVAAALAGATGAGRRRRLGVLLGAVAVTSWCLSALPGWSTERVYLGTDTRLVELVAGALLAVVLRDGLRGLPRHSRVARVAAVAAPVALAAQALVWLTVEDSSTWLFEGGFGLYGVLSTVVILGALGPGPMASALAWRPLVAIGRVSYGVYLYHWPVYLWLTPARAGFGGVGLAAVRFAATGALAALSFTLIEDPIRRRRARRAVTRPALAGAMAGILVAAGLALPRSEAVDIAGIGADGAVEPDVAPARDGSPWQVLLVVDAQSEQFVDELAGDATQQRGWEVAGVLRLDCPRVQAAGGACSWERSWAALAARADIDAAVVLTDAWDYRAELARRLPDATPTSVEAVDWAASRFVTGLDILRGERQRPVVWIGWPVDAADGRRLELAEVDWSMERRITAALPTLVHVDLAVPTVEAIRDTISVQAAAAGGEDDAVMVVGDSVAASMAAGLAAWGEAHGVVVWNNSRGGCGVIRSGQRVGLDGSLSSEDDCREWREGWATAAQRWSADLVVVLVGVWDVSDRRLPEQNRTLGPGDPRWDRFVFDEYAAALEELEGIAPVVVMTPPCMGYEGERVPGGLGGGHPVFAGDRQRYLRDEVLPALPDEHANTRIHDLFADLCPDGRFAELTVDGELVRPDGVHFGEVGAAWWAGNHAAAVLGRD